MGSVKIDDMRRSIPLLQKVIDAANVDQNSTLSDSEEQRVRIRDNFVTRDTISKAFRAVWHDDPTVAEAVDKLEGAVRSAKRADRDNDGFLSEAEGANASALARQLATFASLHVDKKLTDFKVKPYEKPGSRAWALLARGQYQDALDLFKRPQFGSAWVIPVADAPPNVRRGIEAMVASHPGELQVAKWLVNGEPVYFAHSKRDTSAQVLIQDGAGHPLGGGVARKQANGEWKARFTG